MQGKQAIINKIINDAEVLACNITKEAEEKRDKTLSDAETLAGDYKKVKKQIIDKEEEAIINRKISAADIEVKKMLLQKKQDIIASVFDSVKSNAKKDVKRYKNFLMQITEKYCENGDIVVVSSSDKDILTEKDVKDLASKKGISLKYLSGNIDGGIVLKSEYYDKNLSLAALLKQIMEENVTQVSNILFGAGE